MGRKMGHDDDARATGPVFTEDDVAGALTHGFAPASSRPPTPEGPLSPGTGETQWIDLRLEYHTCGSRRAQGGRERSRRPTIASMMLSVALAAAGLAALPYLRLNPVPTLTAAALFTSLLAVVNRGRERRLVRGALVLFLLAGLSFGVAETVSLWQLSARYKRLARHHAGPIAATQAMIKRSDENPDRSGSAKAWKDKRRELVRFIEYKSDLASKYKRAAARPWLPLKPDPPWPW